LQDLATHVGTVVQTKEESWSYATPELGKVATVGIGVDGTCMLICDQKWREAMTGSISLYDKHGERLHTISDLLISAVCDWRGAIANLSGTSMRSTRKAW
jgi:hypothetical protein